MNSTHLSPREFTEALDRTLASDRLEHLDACGSCRQRMLELRWLMEEAEPGGAVPDPSPLFWEHLSRRVHAATVAGAPRPPRAWWRGLWRPLAAVAAAAGAVAVVVVFRPAPALPDPERSPGLAASVPARPPTNPVLAADDASAGLIADLASELPIDELQQVTQPPRGTTAAVIGQLSPAQCEVMVRLIKAQLDGTE